MDCTGRMDARKRMKYGSYDPGYPGPNPSPDLCWWRPPCTGFLHLQASGEIPGGCRLCPASRLGMPRVLLGQACGHWSCHVQMSRGAGVPLRAAGDSCRGPCPGGETTLPGVQACGEAPPTHSHHLNLCSWVCCSPPPSPSTQTQGPSSPSPSITEDKREAPRPWTTCLWPWRPGQGLLWLGEARPLEGTAPGSQCLLTSPITALPF